MTENTAGADTPVDGPDRIAENLHRNALKHQADLNDPLTLAGYEAAAAAVLAHAAAVLPDADRSAYSEAMLAIVDALAVDEAPFNTGWNAFLAEHTTIMRRAVTAGQVSQASGDLLFDAAARLLHQD